MVFYSLYIIMTKKSITTTKASAKVEKGKKKLVAQKWEEILKWKIKNVTQKRFFSLEEKEQNFLETTYMIVSQMCPELTWEDFLDHLRKTDKFNTWAKSIIKKAVWKL